jgi:HK97 gp10 family phage protein
MVGNLQFDIKGGKELADVLKKLPEGMGEKICAASLRAGAKVIQTEAKDSAPVSTVGFSSQSRRDKRTSTKNTKQGQVTELIHLRDQIKITSARTEGLETRLKVYTGKAFWAIFLEFGTSKMAARPWLRPAYERVKAIALQAIGNALGKGIETRAKKLAGSLAKSGLIKKRRR